MVPVYNVRQYIEECLMSIKAQTFADFEAIVVDDGSTDGSGEILDAFAVSDQRFKVFHGPNRGQAAARNFGLEHAIGDYLMFCDSDDLYKPQMCERMLATIERERADVVQCRNDWTVEDGTDAEVAETRLSAEGYFNPPIFGVIQLTDRERLLTNVILWNKIFRRELVERFHIRFPSGHEVDDDAFCQQYELVASNIFHIEDRLYIYRVRNGSVMASYLHRRPRNRGDFIASAAFVLDFALRQGLAIEHAPFLRDLISRAYCTDRKFFEDFELPAHLADYNALLGRVPGTRFRIVDTGRKQLLLPMPAIVK